MSVRDELLNDLEKFIREDATDKALEKLAEVRKEMSRLEAEVVRHLKDQTADVSPQGWMG